MKFLSFALGLSLLILTQKANAQFDENGFKQALKVKKNAYLSEGSFSGGDGANTDFHISQIRLATNPAGYDRVVIEVKPESGRPPFYLVENDPSNKRVQITLYGQPKLDFSSQTAIQQAKKTKQITKLEFVPLLGSDRFTMVIKTQAAVKIEVFELSQPSRIIIDLKP